MDIYLVIILLVLYSCYSTSLYFKKEKYKKLLKIEKQKNFNERICIAVFTKDQRDFVEINYTPENMFYRIKSYQDLYGRKFTGIIKTRHFWGNKIVESAYDCLRARQPELFK